MLPKVLQFNKHYFGLKLFKKIHAAKKGRIAYAGTCIELLKYNQKKENQKKRNHKMSKDEKD